MANAPADGMEPGCITVEITNDDAGTDKTSGFGFGLTGMRERVHALGGRLVLAQGAGAFLSVIATLPLPARGEQARASAVAGSA